MQLTSVYPVVLSADVAAAADFWRTQFGFATTFDSGWYVSLRRQQWELGIVAAEHDTVPAGHRQPTAALLINLEVDDVDEQYRRLVLDGPLRAVLPLRSEPFGQRHFIVAAPDGVLVDVITPIEPDASYAPHVSTATAASSDSHG
ncbi:VOC family protein [Paenibacillus sp. TRM 82003]|uniref:VOC family protein n=1 Tax=Kineococcus sp. TRM81007 TaxID=2925831 RepID=UPI001F55B9FE|nr:VOC family protein [Kineococcus sp. TRM81007]MCI2237988.1 VOC family protein [Kineococcus sp. TRM81007]MCI3926003.1 VOC family protein [Paenibacillus sp. TRM 82003]